MNALHAPAGVSARSLLPPVSTLLLALLLDACGGGGGPNVPLTYGVGGSIAGLVDTGLVISNGSDTVTVAAGATSFSMPTRLAAGTAYSLAVKTQPPGQTCLLSGASGMAGSGSAMSASVSCDQWTWAAGSRTTDPAAVYGAAGVAAASVSPGALQGSATWNDAAGNFWLFAGRTTYSSSDLWRFDPGTGLWAWIGSNSGGTYPGTPGVPDPSIYPMGRSFAALWQDAAGDIWIYGGLCFTGSCSGVLADLWKFSASSHAWTWVGNPVTPNQAPVYGTLGAASASNSPGSRFGAAAWVDASGNFWLHGGWSFDGNSYTILGDDWKYDPVAGAWIWMGGTAQSLAAPAYGTRGVAATGNTPGARFLPQQWTDHAGRFWLFGGGSYSATGQGGRSNDLWRFDPVSGLWAWIGGATAQFDAGTRGQRGVPDSGNWPSARDGATTWVDAAGNLWMLGGTAHFTTADPATHIADDLWRYNTATGLWTWISGTGLPGAVAAYGNAPGQASAGLTPGSRYSGIGWSGPANTLWVFGGGMADSSGTPHGLGDLWSYRVPQFPAGQ